MYTKKNNPENNFFENQMHAYRHICDKIKISIGKLAGVLLCTVHAPKRKIY